MRRARIDDEVRLLHCLNSGAASGAVLFPIGVGAERTGRIPYLSSPPGFAGPAGHESRERVRLTVFNNLLSY